MSHLPTHDSDTDYCQNTITTDVPENVSLEHRDNRRSEAVSSTCLETSKRGPEIGKMDQEISKRDIEIGKMGQEINKMGPEIGKMGQEINKMGPEIGKMGQEINKMGPEIGKMGQEISKRSPETSTIGPKCSKKSKEINKRCLETLMIFPEAISTEPEALSTASETSSMGPELQLTDVSNSFEVEFESEMSTVKRRSDSEPTTQNSPTRQKQRKRATRKLSLPSLSHPVKFARRLTCKKMDDRNPRISPESNIRSCELFDVLMVTVGIALCCT